jgi:NifU-like protein
MSLPEKKVNNLASNDGDSLNQTSPEVFSWEQLEPVQRVVLLQQVIEKEIRPYLNMERGDIELYDVEEETVTVLIKGACSVCPSIKITLKERVEKTLHEFFSTTLKVKAILT